MRRKTRTRARTPVASPVKRRAWCAASPRKATRCGARPRPPKRGASSSPISPKTGAACCATCAQAQADTARYRELVVDLENNALPPLLTGPNTFDDLKLIVGVGPVLERMLHRLGVATYRQIAHWSERDIDEIDAKLPEFPGRIRRDGWVTQARELHQSKYGETAGALGQGRWANHRRVPTRIRWRTPSCRSCCWQSYGAATGRCSRSASPRSRR